MAKKIFRIAFLAIILMVASRHAFAYRPFGTEDAGVAGKGVEQAELSWDYLKWNDGNREQVFLLVPIYGLTERLDLSAEVPYLVHRFAGEPEQEGIGDINLVGKYLLIAEGENNPAFTAKGVVKLDSGNFDKGLGSGDKDYGLFAVASRTMGAVTVHGQMGYTWVGKRKDGNLRNIYLYGLALDYAVSDAFHLVTEINGNRHPDRQEREHLRYALLGAAYRISQTLTADLGVRWGLTSATPDWSTTTGVSITF